MIDFFTGPKKNFIVFTLNDGPIDSEAQINSFDEEIHLIKECVFRMNKRNFVVVLESFYSPQEAKGLMDSIENNWSKTDLYLDFVVIHVHNEYPIKNLPVGNEKINFYLSLKMIFAFLKTKQFDEKVLLRNLHDWIDFLDYDPQSLLRQYVQIFDFEYFGQANKEEEITCIKYLAKSFFELLLSYRSLTRKFTTEKEKQMQLLLKNFVKTLKKFDEKFPLNCQLKFFKKIEKDSGKLRKSNKFFYEVKNFDNTLFYGVFMNKNILDKLHQKYDFILQNLHQLDGQFQKKVEELKVLRNEQQKDVYLYEQNHHMNVCYLGGR